MKSKYLFILLIASSLILSASHCCAAYSESFSTGKDWTDKMSKGEKFISVYAPMILFQRYGVNFKKTPNQYIETLDRVLLNNPYLEKEDVANIFASTVYAYEPESRPAFRIMEMEFAGDKFSPFLSIKTSSNPEVNPSE